MRFNICNDHEHEHLINDTGAFYSVQFAILGLHLF